MHINEFMKERLVARENKENFRSLRSSPHLIDFTSNDYLGLARSPHLHHLIQKKTAGYTGYLHGSTGSRLLTGQTELFEQVEKKIAKFHQAESALLYNSGYTANLGLLDAILQPKDCVIYDIHIHASFQDGIRLSQVKSFAFRHNDLVHLEKRLHSLQNEKKRFVCVEAVYSLDGSIAPLKSIQALCQKYDACLIVDEAHSAGVMGHQGQGLVSQLNLTQEIFATICTYGKAFGVHGAAILGSDLLRQYLINFSRPFCYTTALPLQSVIAIDCAYDCIKKADLKRQQLSDLIAYLQALVQDKQIPIVKSSTSIQALVIPGNRRVKIISERLALVGFDIRPIMSPTVKRGQEILRLCLHSFNTYQEIDYLVEKIQVAIQETA
jgi:8-amino-7-oxononanoate synthase